MTYSETILSIATSLTTYFDEVYYNASLVQTGKTKKPVVSKATEWIDLSPSDTKEILYIRRNGEDEVVKDLELGGCTPSYKMRSGLRIVFFKDHAKKPDEILSKLMKAVLIGGVKLKSITRDAFKLLKDESSGSYSFGPTTAYFALDVYALWDLVPSTCEEDFCETDNLLKKCN